MYVDILILFNNSFKCNRIFFVLFLIFSLSLSIPDMFPFFICFIIFLSLPFCFDLLFLYIPFPPFPIAEDLGLFEIDHVSLSAHDLLHHKCCCFSPFHPSNSTFPRRSHTMNIFSRLNDVKMMSVTTRTLSSFKPH